VSGLEVRIDSVRGGGTRGEEMCRRSEHLEARNFKPPWVWKALTYRPVSKFLQGR
jgi:hypothetical protein